MNSEEIIKLKQCILEEIKTTSESISSLEQQVKPIAPDNAIGRLSRMEAISAKSINEANLNNARIKLEKLKNIVTDMDDDPDFGLCLECGEDIPYKRLMLVPESGMCVQCAGKLE